MTLSRRLEDILLRSMRFGNILLRSFCFISSIICRWLLSKAKDRISNLIWSFRLTRFIQNSVNTDKVSSKSILKTRTIQSISIHQFGRMTKTWSSRRLKVLWKVLLIPNWRKRKRLNFIRLLVIWLNFSVKKWNRITHSKSSIYAKLKNAKYV